MINLDKVGITADVEQAIIERLLPLFPAFVVEAYPDDPDTYNLMHNKGAILVTFKGSQRTKDSASFCGYKESNCFFNIFVLSRNLRAREMHQGCYGALEILKLSLEEWQPETIEECDSFEFIQDSFIEKVNSVSIYGSLFKTVIRGI